MVLAEIIAEIMEALHKDSEAVIVFDESEAKGIRSITFYSDCDDGLTANVTASTGSGAREFKNAIGLVVYHSRAVTGVF